MDGNQSKIVNYVIEKLKNSKDDNEKISILFLMLKLDAQKLSEDKRLIKLYLALSPTFIYRLLKSAKTKNPILEEIELGIQILSYFISNEEIIGRAEMLPMIECIICAIDELKNNKTNLTVISQIICHALNNPEIKTNILNNSLLEYLKIIKFCDKNDVDVTLKNCSDIISHSFDPNLIIETVARSCELITDLNHETKLKGYDLIMCCITKMSKCKKINIKTNFIKSISKYISGFLVSSNPIHHKSNILLANFLLCCPLNQYYDALEVKAHLNLSLNLCLVELQLFLGQIELDTYVLELTEQVEACMYIIESCLLYDQFLSDYHPEMLIKLNEFKIDLNKTLHSCPIENLQHEAVAAGFKLLCAFWSQPLLEFEAEEVNKFTQTVAKILESHLFDEDQLVTWISPFLKIFHENSKINKYHIEPLLIDHIFKGCKNTIETLNKNMHEITPSCFFYQLIHVYQIIGLEEDQEYNVQFRSELLDTILETLELRRVETNTKLCSVLYLCVIVLARKEKNAPKVENLFRLIKTYKIENIVNKSQFSGSIIYELLLLATCKTEEIMGHFTEWIEKAFNRYLFYYEPT
ncbi:hypothetical protein HZS_1517, partial [Henneguya salminicola]